MAQPHRAYTAWGEDEALLLQLIGRSLLAIGRKFYGHGDYGPLYFLWYPVFQQGFLAGDLV